MELWAVGGHEVIVALMRQGAVDMLDWLLEHDVLHHDTEMDEAIKTAMLNGHIHVLQWIVEHYRYVGLSNRWRSQWQMATWTAPSGSAPDSTR